MKEILEQIFQRLLADVQLERKRFLYDSFKIARLTGLVGPRGVGKTTLMLQYIKEQRSSTERIFYFSADSVYLQQTTLFEFVNELYLTDGYRLIFIDEIHKYTNWSQELKNLYDGFPDLQIVFSGSSMLDIVKGSYDLSRRARMFNLPGLSFREYLYFKTGVKHPKIELNELLSDASQFSKLSLIEMLKGHFSDYLQKGYYPFAFDEPESFEERMMRIIDKTIFEDIAGFYKIKTENLHIFKKLLGYLATIPPGEVNTHNIAQSMKIASQTVNHFLEILSEVGLVNIVWPDEGGKQLLRKAKKIFLKNTTLLYVLHQFTNEHLSIGMMREIFFLQALDDIGMDTFYAKKGVFIVNDVVFEIGGKNKGRKQLRDVEQQAYLVKDDILIAAAGTLPLIYFGFLS